MITHTPPQITCALGAHITEGEQYIRDQIALVALPPNMSIEVMEGHPLRIDEDPMMIDGSCIVATMKAWWPDANQPFTTSVHGADHHPDDQGIFYSGAVSYSYTNIVFAQYIWDACSKSPELIPSMLWNAAQELWMHELREMFKFNGDFYFRPHNLDGSFCWSNIPGTFDR